MPELFVGLKNPSDSNKFTKYNKDDFNIYVNKDLQLEENIRIRFPEYASDLPGKELEVTGIVVPRPN